MALQKTITKNGVTIPNCYIKITHIEGNKDSVLATVSFMANNDAEPFMCSAHAFNPQMISKNFIQQGYEFLKSLPDFSNSEDC